MGHITKKHYLLNSSSVFKQKRLINFHQVALLCLINLINLKYKCVQNKTALKCTIT